VDVVGVAYILSFYQLLILFVLEDGYMTITKGYRKEGCS